jgi:hypothetical protein
MFLVPTIDQMYKEMKKIVEVGNKHGNRDEFPDFVDLFFFCIKNVRVYRKHTYFFFWPYTKNGLFFHSKLHFFHTEFLI